MKTQYQSRSIYLLHPLNQRINMKQGEGMTLRAILMQHEDVVYSRLQRY